MSVDARVKMSTGTTAGIVISIIDLIDDQIENRGKYLTPETKLQSVDAVLRKKRNRKFTEQPYTGFGFYIDPKIISPY